MLISYNWLKDFIQINESPEKLGEILTDTGLEVEKIHPVETIRGGLKGLVVGEVKTCVAAENSDKLKLTSVSIGQDSDLQIVCGAPNVEAGQKVVVATVGTTLYPTGNEGFKIKKSKIRGNVSEGMLCAEDEIGLGTSHDGIMVLDNEAKPGTPLADLLDIKTDYQIEIGLTPNRGDATSHWGTARDVRAKTEREISLPEIATIERDDVVIDIDIQDLEACPRYSGILLDNIKVEESPNWLKERLVSIGLTPKNNVVDVTNYVLHEIGQPIHAFDANLLDGNIAVRRATEGEMITTLDDTERKLSGFELLICDQSRPLALAGVFGGLNSGVTDKTTSVFIESAYFDPSVIRKCAKSQGLNTDASFRYERGCDPNITVFALRRVVQLLQEVAGAQCASGIVDRGQTKFPPREVQFSVNWLNAFCGTELSTQEITRILNLLDIETTVNGDNINAVVPPYRSEVTRPVDIAEEVLRIHGYNSVKIPEKISMRFGMKSNDLREVTEKASSYLVGKGFLETMSNSQTVKNDSDNAVEILNPLSIEYAIMRTDMRDGILKSLAFNLNRKNNVIKFFEFGKTYKKGEKGYIESNQLIIVASGAQENINWTTSKRNSDVFFIKGIVAGLAQILGVKESKMMKNTCLTEGSPKEKKLYGIKKDFVYAVINWDAIVSLSGNSKFKIEDIPKFPTVQRDLSVVLNHNVTFDDISKIVKNVAGNYLRHYDVFDVYTGDKLEEGKKSIAFSITLYDSKQTMTDKKIDAIMGKIMKSIEDQLGGIIRK